MLINLQLAQRLRKPNEWNTYKNPIDNLIHAILIQAICDANGYIDSGNHQYNTGDEAMMFLSKNGVQYFQYLMNAPKNPITISAQRSRIRNYKKKMKAGVYYG